MTDEKRALLGDHEAAKRLTDAGVLLPCMCGETPKEHGPEDWEPTFYDPDSGGDPVSIECECGIGFSIWSYDYYRTRLMNTWAAFVMGEANRGKELMVFDWDKAARLIRERKPEYASAGLQSDWEYTGGTIYEDGKPVMDDYTYLASTWAVPELDIDGDIVECFRMEHEVPGWGSKTKWPKSALDILSAEEMEMLDG